MGMRQTLDPYGGPTVIVDALIGDAYPRVRLVADNIDAVIALAPHLAALSDLAENINVLPSSAEYTAAVATVEAAALATAADRLATDVSAGVATSARDATVTARDVVTQAAASVRQGVITLGNISVQVQGFAQTAQAYAIQSQVNADSLVQFQEVISGLSLASNTDPMTYFASNRDLGSIVVTGVFAAEKVVGTRIDFAKDTTGTLNIGSLT